MTFETILPLLKEGKKVVRSAWNNGEEYIQYVPETELEGKTMTPYFVIYVTHEGFSMFQPTVCDILAQDWKLIDG